MIVVTGGSGFLGGAVARALLARGHRVRVVQRRDAPELRSAGASVVQADLSNREQTLSALEGSTAVLHVAASTRLWGDEEGVRRANVDATSHVIEACRRWNISRLVYTSTPSVVHAGHDTEGVDETAPIPRKFLSPYPRTKAQAEALVLAANDEKLSTCALRPHLIWGPNDPQLTGKLLERARSGKLRLVGGGHKRVDTTYIDNAVHAHLLALDKLRPGAACAGKAYFIAQDEPMPQSRFINAVLAAAGLPMCEKNISRALAWLVGWAMEVAWTVGLRTDEPPMTRFLASQLGTAHWYDLSAAKRDLGYSPLVDTREGLRRLRASLQGAHRG